MQMRLTNFRIGTRLIMLIGVLLVMLVSVGVAAVFGLNAARITTAQLNDNVTRVLQLQTLVQILQGELITTANRVNAGVITWEEGRQTLDAGERALDAAWDEYFAGLNTREQADAIDTLGNPRDDVRQAMSELRFIFNAEQRTTLELFVINDLEPMTRPFLQGLLAETTEQQQLSQQVLETSVARNQLFLYINGGIAVAAFVLAAVLGWLVYRSISSPIKRLSETVSRVAAGDYEVRSGIDTGDEVGALSRAFDHLLEDKVQTLARTEQENEQLNNSVIAVLHAVSRLSQRDLTVKVPVTEDVAGPVADAINQMVQETSEVLKEVRRIAGQVEEASGKVHDKAEIVNDVARLQQEVVERTAIQLDAASERLAEIAQLAERCNTIAQQTLTTTHTAAGTVSETLAGMNDIRETIQTTGKRIKRLGERSQEINSVVDMINSIAERTTVLALNASMQAAAAGEAGRGFAVVADEVQRLAESSRNATGQIAALVKNIQVETNDSIAHVEQTISKVVEETALAEIAGQKMSETERITQELVDAVRQIAAHSEEQSRIAIELRDQARGIQQQTRETGQQLSEQLVQTDNLASYSRQLLESVRVFKLSA